MNGPSLPWRVSHKDVVAGSMRLDPGEWELTSDDYWYRRGQQTLARPPVERYPNPDDRYSERRLELNSVGCEIGLGIAATIRADHVKILRREMDRKLVVMATQEDTWSGENP